jgi:hypothetical protein
MIETRGLEQGRFAVRAFPFATLIHLQKIKNARDADADNMSRTLLGRFLGVCIARRSELEQRGIRKRSARIYAPGGSIKLGLWSSRRSAWRIRFSVRRDGMRADTLAAVRFPDGVDLFPDHVKKFPCYGIKNSLFVHLWNWAETLDKSWLFRLSIPSHFTKFPVFFPVTGDFSLREGSNQTALSASQSAIFAFSAEK